MELFNVFKLNFDRNDAQPGVHMAVTVLHRVHVYSRIKTMIWV